MFQQSMKGYDYFSNGSLSDIDANDRLKEKLDFLGISKIRRETVHALKEVYAKNADDMINKFYERLHQMPSLHNLIVNNTTDERLKKTFHLYMKSLFEDELNLQYVFKRRAIAEAHAKIGLTPDWMLAAFNLLNQLFVPYITKEYVKKPKMLMDALLAYESMVVLDQQIIMETYIELQATNFIKGLSNVISFNADIDEVKELVDYQQEQYEASSSVSDIVEDFSNSIEEIASSVSEINTQSQSHLKELDENTKTLTNMTAYLNQVDQGQRQVLGHVGSLISHVNNMQKVMSFIQDVAEQTNLLALNASIEAARAGEQGKGFAVVAQEVRKLADNTKQSISDISEDIKQLSTISEEMNSLINDTSSMLHKGVEDTQNLSHTIGELNHSLQHIGARFENISAITQQQTASMDEITYRNRGITEAAKKGVDISRSTGQAVYDLSKIIDEHRIHSISSNMKISQEDIIELAITDHILWRWRIYNLILGFDSLSENDVSSAQDCRLGQWYYGYAKRLFENEPAYRELEEPHRKLHDLAKKAVQAVNSGNKEQAEQLLEEITTVSKVVVEKLKLLKQVIIKQKESFRSSVHGRN
ncbi:methyl-accepting chemotaxis protein [Bacillus tianshenii]|nr:methyl-accepting chemotaxis protein [Bacillus tianshenii]